MLPSLLRPSSTHTLPRTRPRRTSNHHLPEVREPLLHPIYPSPFPLPLLLRTAAPKLAIRQVREAGQTARDALRVRNTQVREALQKRVRMRV